MHAINIPDWAVARGRAMNHFSRIDPLRTALIAIDLQNAFMLPDQVFGNPHACDIVPYVNRLAGALRDQGGLVLWTRQTITTTPPHAYPDWQFDPADAFVRSALEALTEGNAGHRLHHALDVATQDIVVNKYRYSAFIKNSSTIEEILHARGIATLIIAGTLTNVCCETSARDAYMLGFRILFIADATAAVTDAEHNAALLNLALNFADVRRTDEVMAMILNQNGNTGASSNL